MKLQHRDGTVTEQEDSLEKPLNFLYGTTLGRLLLKPLTARWVSRLAGAFLSTPLSKGFIKSFIQKNGIDMSQFEEVTYRSYNEFFSRKIKPEARPTDMDPKHLISPCDCKLTALSIGEDTVFTLKHTPYTVSSLLKNEELADRFRGGTALIFRLCVDDYHRYCYTADGEKTEQVRIPGAFHTVNPIANDFFPIYKENTREYCLLDTDAFGQILVMEVGALLVGRIVNHQSGIARVTRGTEKGYFQFGGSTIVMLLPPNAAAIDQDILEASQKGLETVVRYGEKIGLSTK